MFIYCLPIIDSSWQDIESHLLSFVSLKRQEKVLNYHYSIDKKLSLYSALLVRMQLSILTGIPNHELLFHYNLYGKPILLSNPEYHFSISHTHHMILCAISSKGPIGIDIEAIDKELSIECMSVALHPIEIQYLNSIPSHDQHLYFYKIWTQKEAYVKFLGTGFSIEASDINTLEPKLAAHLYTWKYLNYMCSVFMSTTKNKATYPIQFISEPDIQDYFLNYKLKS